MVDELEDYWDDIRPDRTHSRRVEPPMSYVWVGMTFADEIRDLICIAVPSPIRCRERNIRGEYSDWTRNFVIFKGHYLPSEPKTIEGFSLFLHPEDDTPVASMTFGGALIVSHTNGYQLSFRILKPGEIRRAWIIDDPDGQNPVLYENPWDINMNYPNFSPAIDRAITNNLKADPLEVLDQEHPVSRALAAASESRFKPVFDNTEWKVFLANTRDTRGVTRG
jgi:hypothetical protein